MKKAPRDPATEIPFPGLGEFSDDFKKSRKEDLVTLYTALEIGDYLLIKRMCHTWRGFAIPYGFGELAHLSNELEECCEKKDIDQCKILLSDIESYLSSK